MGAADRKKPKKSNIISDGPNPSEITTKKKSSRGGGERRRSEARVHTDEEAPPARGRGPERAGRAERRSKDFDAPAIAKGPAPSESCCGCLCRCMCMGFYGRTGLTEDGSSAVFKAWAFAAGTQCYAYRGYYFTGPKKGQRCCVKRLRAGPKTDRPPKPFERDVEISKMAAEIAKSFNALPGDKRSLQFNIPMLCRIESCSFANPTMRNGEWVTVEDWLPGKFEKFITNGGAGASKGSLTSFCHYSYDYTDGKYLIVDMQGVMESTRYRLTDPAIHTTKAEQYGELDHGKRGIYNFFATHECTGLCRGLKAPKIPAETLRQIRHDIELNKEEAVGFAHGHR